jgi:anhydro-N-acetylmuramic acid kinase
MITRVVGLISGTSVDGIDAALVEITGTDNDLNLELLAGETYPYPVALREKILAVCGGASLSMAELAELDDAIAYQFAQAAQTIQLGQAPAALIGSHGQTVYHRPPLKKEARSTSFPQNSLSTQDSVLRTALGYSLQLGRGEVIASLTGIPTVSNFRVADIAAGGQGAPLVSKIDVYLFSDALHPRCVQNIGGIGNLTYLPPRNQANWEQKVTGWDTGPGNALLDLAVQHFTNGNQTYDQDGRLAAEGTCCEGLLNQWLQDEFFQQLPPKSTGREYFGVEYWQRCLQEAIAYQLTAADVLATLTELTVASIAHSYETFLPQLPQQVLLCGGGSRNLYLKQRLAARLPSVSVLTTQELGVSADFKEAIAFAVLAYWRQLGIPGNLPAVTGAEQAMLLGEVHLPIPQSA